MAFAVGCKWQRGCGFALVGAHSDSPNLQVRPTSALTQQGYHQLAVSTYGGGLWHTWFDRDLTVAGRVFVADAEGKVESRLVSIGRPLLRIPSLAIHLDRSVNEAFKFNTETHLIPVLETAVKAQLQGMQEGHPADLVALLAAEVGCAPDALKAFELSLVDTQPATIGGARNEFIFGARLDNLFSTFCAVEALRESSTPEQLAEEEVVRVAAIFDHEEVGSRSSVGAASPLLQDCIERVVRGLLPEGSGEGGMQQSKQRSFLVSADMAHAVHPNYPEKHEARHRPLMHHGVALKLNVDQRYATSPATALLIEECARQARPPVPLQRFLVRNDSPCGSTIGPILAGDLGVRTVDIGAPQLSMHSSTTPGPPGPPLLTPGPPLLTPASP